MSTRTEKTARSHKRGFSPFLYCFKVGHDFPSFTAAMLENEHLLKFRLPFT
ncbi:hypothetical protein AB434_1111 [Heyndrickxia coagulans]|uniref:Uncharacterized protein n=1 Tax=Heyndrickxia coagulans TaxID=1398 RepID=A0A0C5C2G7_HEYCO|nr:hypothetical protein SB48_HM08orf00051 [Heyndrickxia coagulans]AKN53516.1 hypothetical protein AB434_1111 [Heyndrickxia coagulans]KWZ83300.1 hypothetical protein HMPREF3213_01288 [Heyndrickxia coagulans]KYC61098.1 hypothetical protein B4100_1429 [Heyndrickxia coagulans]